MNWFLIIVAIVVVLITLIVNIRLLQIYLDPEEKHQGGGYFPKTCVVLGLSMAAYISLLLPFDVANRKDPTVRDDVGGELDIAFMWQLTLWCVVGMVVVVLPFALFYYEAWDPDRRGAVITREFTNTDDNQFRIIGSQIAAALCWTSFTVIIFVGILCIIYWGGIDTAVIPYEAIVCRPENVALTPCFRRANMTDVACADVVAENYASQCIRGDGELNIKVSIFVAAIALLTCIGWVLFMVFGGVGLSSLPMDMWFGFYENRILQRNKKNFSEECISITHEAKHLLDISNKLLDKLSHNKGQQKKVTAYQLAVDKLESRHRRNQRYNKQSPFARLASPFVVWGRGLLMVICVIWSLMWILHICVHNAADMHPMLNNLFVELDSAFGLLGTVTYASFSFYLLWATVNGCFKVGMNFLIFTIHPMKVKGTLMSSFLFNTILVVLASVAVVSFCALSFREYAANTVVDTLYSSYINKMQYLTYIMQNLQYALIGFAALGLCWYTCKGPKSYEQLMKEQDEDDE
eukprot:TRINITY_DN20936_c0_g1_i1.p1 TRINITY_DN20936_c0_g1~~TRINITY_DN20936_c0_g1_i1.p1  ORF type:complete len:520 (+),score=217.31 TRINITY_DN20936_c0_g1_i1:68-1627(+)